VSDRSHEEPIRARAERAARERPPRRAPLPESAPKEAQEDPGAPDRVRQLMAAPSYLPADEDVAFLREPGTRGVRLQLDYQKAEALLQASGIRHTIVVFGSTRLAEPDAARRRLEAARAAAAACPGDPDCRRALAIAERVHANSRYYEVARELGRIVGALGDEPAEDRMVVVTGGGPGIMEAANRGAFDVGAKSVGLNITLPREQFPNPYATPELCLRFHYFAMRKLHFLLRARALVAFPGGYGTLDELFETLTLVQTRTMAPVPIVLVGAGYWARAVDFDFLVSEGTIDPEDRELFTVVETARDAWDAIQEWYRRRDPH
jgi:uncharacterized protein (TIGR00730 family)